MPAAFNPETGEILSLGTDGQWAPAPRAKNPETGKELFYDGKDWQQVPYQARMPEEFKGRAKADASRGFLGRMTDAAVQGATFGFSDELAAGVSRLFGKDYDKSLEYERERLKDVQAQNPVASTLAQIAGGLTLAPSAASSLVPKAAAEAPAMLELAKRGATVGGTAGAVSGFGAGEGGFQNRLQDAATGATVGAVAGAATPYAIEGGRKLANFAKGAMGLGDQTARAERLLARAVQRDDATPTGLADKARDLAATGDKLETLADIGGENVKRLARAAGSVPGEGTRIVQGAVEGRNIAQAERMLTDVKTYLSPVDDFHGLMDAVIRKRSADASPLYDKAFQTKFIWNERLQEFIDDPVVKRGIAKGLEVQRLEALAQGKKFDPMDYGVKDFNAAGEPVIGATPNLRLLDSAKRGLDEIIDEARDTTTGKIQWTQRLRAVDDVRRALVGKLDELTTISDGGQSLYAQARKAWAGPSAAKDALEFGRYKTLRSDPESIAKRIADMGDGEREFAKAGAARALSDIIQGKADDLDVTKGMLRTPRMRAQMKAIFGDGPGMEQFVKNVERERELFKTGSMIAPRAGSQTQLRQADVAELLQEPGILGDAIGQAARGNFTGAAFTAAKGQIPRLTQGVGNRTAAELAKLLMAPGVKGVSEATQRMAARLLADDAARRQMGRIATGLLAPAEGTVLGLNSP